ncbi:hypothetical protein [Ureibacillus chungkukjangi]|uniref:Uncharacterized protein n=1 Tax=Ureibacillus chungkukjangi TaxID=1202712 RepID=A0A318TLC4_9BACL|nr:hypothetical protein [Ureibacillus chungkukjangi]MCM3390303.1 hypothetical protein [Ureibacillus chungkukjangi]PYF02655.1 hypothetical protein BJ095_13810 [Ureibacillus chungkukjangi]
MYIEKVRITIKSLGDEQYNEFILKLRNKLKYKFGIDTKPSELKKQVDNFLNNKTEKISIRYLEAYLLTLNDLSVNGGIKAIVEGKLTSANSWRDLLILATQDQPLPLGVNVDVLDEVLIKDIKSLFTNIIKYCANENKEVFRHNIHTVNQFLSIKKDLEQ